MFGLTVEQLTALATCAMATATVVMAAATVVLAFLAHANWRVAQEMKALAESNLKLSEEMKQISERATKGSLSDLFKAGLELAKHRTIHLAKTLEAIPGAAPRTDLGPNLRAAAQEWYENDFVKRVVVWEVSCSDLQRLIDGYASAPPPTQGALVQKATEYAASLRTIEREQMQYNPAVLDRWYRAL